MPSWSSEFVQTSDLRMHYLQQGTGDPVVLIHGWNGSTFSFRHQIPELAQHFRVIALDLRGYGYSSRDGSGDCADGDLCRIFDGSDLWLVGDRADAFQRNRSTPG